MWPSMRYRRSRIKAPHIAAHLEQGRIPLESAIAAHDKLANIRQAVRRAGGDEKAADDLVQHKEREFLPHAMRNSSHTFSRFAKSRSDAEIGRASCRERGERSVDVVDLLWK